MKVTSIILCLTLCVHSIVILTCSQYKIIEIVYIPFSHCLKSGVCFTPIVILIWTKFSLELLDLYLEFIKFTGEKVDFHV